MAAVGGMFVRIRPRVDAEAIDAMEALFVAIGRAADDVVDACRTYRAAFERLEEDPGADARALLQEAT